VVRATAITPEPVAGRAASASRSVLVNTGATGMRAAEGVVVVIGHLPGRAETREAGPGQVPATMIHLTVRPGHMTTQRHFELPKRGRTLTAGARRIAEYLRPGFRLVARPGALILLGSVRVAAGPTRRLLIVHGHFMPSFPDAAGDGR